ncbi:hypothetical protein V8C86DRAFT_2975537, partial [Haematococcus lacustris]
AHHMEGLDELSGGRRDSMSCCNLATSSHQASKPQHAEPCHLGHASVHHSTILISVACCAPRNGQCSPGVMLHSPPCACQGLRAGSHTGPSLQLLAVDPVALPLPACHCPPCSVPATVSPTTDEGFADALRWLEACSPPLSPWALHSPRPQPGTLPHPSTTSSASIYLTCHLLLEGMPEAGATPFLAKDGALPAVATETCQLPFTCRLLVLLGHEVLVEQQVALASLLAGAGLRCERGGEQQQAAMLERDERGQAQASLCTVAGAGSCAAVPSAATLPHYSQTPGPQLLEVQLKVPRGGLAAALQRHARLRSALPFPRPGPGCGSGAADPGLAAPAGQPDRPSSQAAPWDPVQHSPLPHACCGAVALKVLLLPGLSDDSLAARPGWTCGPTAAPGAGLGLGLMNLLPPWSCGSTRWMRWQCVKLWPSRALTSPPVEGQGCSSELEPATPSLPAAACPWLAAWWCTSRFGDTTTIALGPGAAAEARRLHGSLLDFFTLAELPACRLFLHDLQPSPPASSRASWDSAATGSAPSPCPFPNRPAALTKSVALGPAAPLAAARPAGPPGVSGMVGEVLGRSAGVLMVLEQIAKQVPGICPAPLRRAWSLLQPGMEWGTRLVKLLSWE